MPSKTTKADQPYSIDGKMFTWQPLDENDERGNLPPVNIPMRVKLKIIRTLAGHELDADGMFDIFERLIPDQAEALDEMDLNDFQDMFSAWQTEYKALSGASLGE